MRPLIALEQMALLRDRLSTPNYQSYMQPFLEDMDRKDTGPVIADARGRPSGWAFCNREVLRLTMAEAYFVSADMVQVARWAAAGLGEHDTFRHDLWPTDYGFLWLEDALVSSEIWGRTITTKALSWGRSVANGKPGTMIVLYTDMLDERDEVNRKVREDAQAAGDWDKYAAMGNLHVHHLAWIPDGMQVGPEQTPVPEDYARWAHGDIQPSQLAQSAPNDQRFILAVLMLMNQSVTSVAREQADKNAAKRFRRMKLPSAVTVVTLRRTAGSRQEGETHVEWTHRWLVRGFWAWRRCGAEHPYAEEYDKGYRCRVYIAPFVKGPEGAPFKQSDKIYSLTR